MPLLLLAIIQSILLASGQVFLKLALSRMDPFGWNWHFWGSLLTNWQFALCGLFYGAGTILWFYIIKHFPFSMAYPMVSLTYVFGMIAAMLVFHEEVSLTRWGGVLLIMAGCYATQAQTPSAPPVPVQSEGQAIIQKMAAAAGQIQTVRCDFTQTRHTKLLKKEQVSHGRMSCQLPDKLLWEYTSPRASTIVLGDELANSQNKFAATMARMMMQLVAGQSLTDSQTFQVTARELPTEYEATLIPLKKNLKQMWNRLVLHFSITQSTVTQVELHEKNGDSTVIELQNIKINE